MAGNSWSKILRLAREERISARKELVFKKSMIRSFTVAGGEAGSLEQMEEDTERQQRSLVNSLLVASRHSMKHNVRSSAQIDAGGDDGRGCRANKENNHLGDWELEHMQEIRNDCCITSRALSGE